MMCRPDFNKQRFCSYVIKNACSDSGIKKSSYNGDVKYHWNLRIR